MFTIWQIHRIFGEMILPILILLAAIWFALSWKPDGERNLAARILPVLIDIQVTIGIVLFVNGAVQGNLKYLSFPFLLHPLLGLITAGYGHLAVKGKPFGNLKRWQIPVSFLVLLVLVLINIFISVKL